MVIQDLRNREKYGLCSVPLLRIALRQCTLELIGIDGYKEKHGYKYIIRRIFRRQKKKAEIILETIIVGFKQIEGSYARYVSVLDEEVLTDD